ncbi:MAG: hypothetical protein KKD48_04930 [Nanoarchaeota archaeon]|nr:hypothetical protein [Nanoarchaeota archaeon]
MKRIISLLLMLVLIPSVLALEKTYYPYIVYSGTKDFTPTNLKYALTLNLNEELSTRRFDVTSPFDVVFVINTTDMMDKEIIESTISWSGGIIESVSTYHWDDCLKQWIFLWSSTEGFWKNRPYPLNKECMYNNQTYIWMKSTKLFNTRPVGNTNSLLITIKYQSENPCEIGNVIHLQQYKINESYLNRSNEYAKFCTWHIESEGEEVVYMEDAIYCPLTQVNHIITSNDVKYYARIDYAEIYFNWTSGKYQYTNKTSFDEYKHIYCLQPPKSLITEIQQSLRQYIKSVLCNWFGILC